MSKESFTKADSKDEAKAKLSEMKRQLGKPATEMEDMPQHWNGVGSVSGSFRGDKAFGMSRRLELAAQGINSDSSDLDRIALKDALIHACNFLLMDSHAKHRLDGYNNAILTCYNKHILFPPSRTAAAAAAFGFVGSEESTCCSWVANLFSCFTGSNSDTQTANEKRSLLN